MLSRFVQQCRYGECNQVERGVDSISIGEVTQVRPPIFPRPMLYLFVASVLFGSVNSVPAATAGDGLRTYPGVEDSSTGRAVRSENSNVAFDGTGVLNSQLRRETKIAYAGSVAAVGLANPIAYTTRSNLPASLAGGAFLFQAVANACDLNSDGVVDNSDVTLAISMSLGLLPCTANILGPAVCNVVMVQRVINAATTGSCVTGNPHSVSLTWVASTSPNVGGYTVYRGPTSGGPYTRITSSLVVGTNYTDNTVAAGQTYYYVVTASDTSNNESVYSNEAQAVVPDP